MVGLVVVGLIGFSTALRSIYAKQDAPVPSERRRRVRVAFALLFVLWLLTFAMLMELADIAALTQQRIGTGALVIAITPFIVSGPLPTGSDDAG